MSKWTLDVGAFRVGVKGCRVYYKTPTSGGWLRAHQSSTPSFDIEIPELLPVDIRAHGIDANGNLLTEFREMTLTGTELVADRDDPATATIPVPAITQDGPTLKIGSYTWDGAVADEYEVEVRTSGTSTDAKDAVTHGIFEASEVATVTAPPDESDVTVHTRLLRKDDGAASGWESNDVEVALPDVGGINDHDTDFAGGTLETLDGHAVLELNSGDLRQTTVYAGDITGVYAGDATTIYAGDAGLYWSPATYTTANLTTGGNEDLQLQLYPEATSLTRGTLYAGDQHWNPVAPETQEDGTPHDPRVLEGSMLNGSDETPLRVDFQVATSDTASPTFTDSDFVPHRPDRVYPNVHTYAVRAIIYTWWGRLVTLDKIHVRRWVFCKTRPWCSHSSSGHLIYQTVLTSNTEYVDWTVTGEDWDELICEVMFVSNKSPSTELELHFNGSSSADVVPSGNSVNVNDYERLRFRVLPKTGQRRRAILDYGFSFDGATGAIVDTATSGATDEWTDTSTPITSIRFTTDDPADAALGSGTTIRVWGRRYFDGA